MPFTLSASPAAETELHCAPAQRAVVSWNSASPAGTIEVRPHDDGGALCDWLPLATWAPGARRSFSPAAGGVRIDTDVIVSERPFSALAVRMSGAAPDALALATPFPAQRSSAYPGEDSHDLLVPERSQYAREGERGWCSAASTSMLLGYYARRLLNDAWNLDVPTVAAAVFDGAYNGTGNWTFNMALAGSLGLRAFVAYLHDFEHARRLIRLGVPLAISYSWREGELDGAPIAQSDGHLAVLRGFTTTGDPILNDPAAAAIRVTYPRAQLEPLWTRGGGVAYVVVPPDRADAVAVIDR